MNGTRDENGVCRILARWSSPLLLFAMLSLAAWTLTLGGCGGDEATVGPKNEDKELAPYIGRLQRYSQKLGYAIRGQRPQLAAFYLSEMKELREQIGERFPEYEEIPIAQYLSMIDPALASTRKSVEASNWEKSRTNYQRLIQSCTSCHAATNHSFIEIKPVSGKPPFNQDFGITSATQPSNE